MPESKCSNFSARHVKGAARVGSYSLWGDVPLLMRQVPRGKMAKSGMRPELRAEIPDELARSVAQWFESGMSENNRKQLLTRSEKYRNMPPQ